MVKYKIIILIDTSYMIFYRFFAILKWYSLAHTNDFKLNNNSSYDWCTNNIFLEKYKKKFLESLINLLKQNIFENSNIFFCIDAPLKTLWRIKLKYDYKYKIISKYNYKSIFNYTYKYLIPKIINNYLNINSIKINNVEADDIIASICLYLKNTDNKIYIISSDNDFLQLGRKNVYFYNFKTKHPFNISLETAYEILKKKIIYGDKSDCIDSIFKKGYGIKKKDLLNNKILFNYLNKNPNIKKLYNLNKKLINFNNIPKIYYNTIIKKFNKLYH